MAKEASTQLMLSAGSFMSRSGCALSQAWLSVSEAQRASYEAEARADGFADFEIIERTPAGEVVAAAQRSVYFPVYYVEPYSGNEAALGFDLGSSQTRLQALNSATDTGDATTTAQITLVQETSTQSGFLFFVPIFAAGLPFETLEERQENLAGFALAVFRVGDMLEADLARLDTTGIDIQLIASTNPADPGVLYSQTSGEQPATPGLGHGLGRCGQDLDTSNFIAFRSDGLQQLVAMGRVSSGVAGNRASFQIPFGHPGTRR